MIGKPLSAQEWQDAFRTADGNKIVEALMPFHERVIGLGRAERDVKVRLAEALGAISAVRPIGAVDADIKEIVDVSMSDLAASAPLIPGIDAKAMGRSLLSAFGEEVRIKKSKELGDLLDEWYGRTHEKRHGKNLMSEVSAILHASLLTHLQRTVPASSFADSTYLGYARNFNLLRVLTYRVGLLAVGDAEAASVIAPFAESMARGVTPIALLKDRTFIVVTA